MQKVMKGTWNEIRGDVKQQWGRLTDDDVMQMRGRLDELVGTVQKRYGYTRQKAQHEVDEFMRTHGMDMQESARSMGDRVQHTVKQYPWAAALVGILVMAMVVGLVIRPSFQRGEGYSR